MTDLVILVAAVSIGWAVGHPGSLHDQASVRTRRIDWRAWVWFLIFGVPLVLWELRGIRRKAKGDTISEGVWWLRDRRTWWSAGLYAAVLLLVFWLPYHFIFGGS